MNAIKLKMLYNYFDDNSLIESTMKWPQVSFTSSGSLPPGKSKPSKPTGCYESAVGRNQHQ